MKKIIVPTDFSPATDNAVHYSIQLAQLTGSSVHLLEFYMIPTNITGMSASVINTPVLLLSAEELRKNTEAALNRSLLSLQAAYPAVQLSAESRMGEVIEELKTVCLKEKPYAVVMGTSESNGVEQMLFGSDALAAIRRLNCPVITVPVRYTFRAIKKIVLATDLGDMAKTPVQKIGEIVQELKAELHIVHVKNRDTNSEAAATLLTESLKTVNPSYHTIMDDDIQHGLQMYTDETGADLLIVLPHEHTWMETFFYRLHTARLVNKAHIPVLCIPERL